MNELTQIRVNCCYCYLELFSYSLVVPLQVLLQTGIFLGFVHSRRHELFLPLLSLDCHPLLQKIFCFIACLQLQGLVNDANAIEEFASAEDIFTRIELEDAEREQLAIASFRTCEVAQVTYHSQYSFDHLVRHFFWKVLQEHLLPRLLLRSDWHAEWVDADRTTSHHRAHSDGVDDHCGIEA